MVSLRGHGSTDFRVWWVPVLVRSSGRSHPHRLLRRYELAQFNPCPGSLYPGIRIDRKRHRIESYSRNFLMLDVISWARSTALTMYTE